jgi:hypothetical protein
MSPNSATAQSADDFWATKPNRLKIAGALNNWADFCANVFHFNRVSKLTPLELEPKINSHLLLSSAPSLEVQRWAEWLPYADPDSDVAKPSQERAADALLAARADPSAATEAEKLYNDTFRGYFRTVFGKCTEGARDKWIAENFYSGEGDFEKAAGSLTVDFSQALKEIDK